MAEETQIEAILLRWEDLRGQGRDVGVEDLCRDCPELRDDVRLRIQALEAVYRIPNGLGHEVETRTSHDASPGPGAVPVRLADFEIIGVLGHGGMGVVYKARQVRLNRLVAVKMIVAGSYASPSDLARFRTEAEAVARLQHPNIVAIYEFGELEGRPYFAMELAEGGSLAQQLDGRPRGAETTARLIEAMARAIHFAHGRGIVHRDLKPANILLAADGTPKIGDFGLAKLIGGEADPADRTQTGSILGTPSYMAPEQAAGQVRAIGPATDVYALGVILYELLTGRSPFRGDTPLETLEQVRTLEPVPPRRLRPSLPRDLEAICLKCLQKDPSRRYPGAGDLADDLRRHLDGAPIVARGPGSLGRLADVVQRGQYDKEFRLWGNVVLATIPLGVIPHLIVFAVALAAPAYLRAAFILPWFVFVTLCGSFFWINRTRLRLPATPAVRQVAAMLVGHVIASSLAPPVGLILGVTARPEDQVKLYPILTLLVGQLYFGMGGSYWGGCYPAGLAFILVAPVMALGPSWAPLEFALIMVASHLAIGLHLRHLGCDAARGSADGPGPIPREVETRSHPGADSTVPQDDPPTPG